MRRRQLGKVICRATPRRARFTRVAGISQLERMPMGGKPLSAAEIALIGRWIDEGAEWPDGVGSSVAQVEKHWALSRRGGLRSRLRDRDGRGTDRQLRTRAPEKGRAPGFA
jgi:hypothetical protein